MDTHNDTSNRSDIFLNVYDAVWSIARVLKNSRSELLKQGKTLENLTYGDANATDLFRKEAVNLNFETPNIGVRVKHFICQILQITVHKNASLPPRKRYGRRRSGLMIRARVLAEWVMRKDTKYSHGTCLNEYGQINARGNLAMDYYPIRGDGAVEILLRAKNRRNWI